MTRIQCAHCAEMIELEPETDIDSGSTFTCPRCNGETIVDLFRPKDRTQLYRKGGTDK